MSNIVDSCPDCGISFDYFIAADVWACKRCGYGLPEYLRKPQKQVMSTAGDNAITKAIQKVKSKTTTKESENPVGGASGVILPMGDTTRSRSEQWRNKHYDDGLNYLRGPSNDLPSSAISISSEVKLVTPDGKNVLDTYYAPDKLREFQKQKRMEQEKYDGRYEGRSSGYSDDPDNFSNSGLKV